MGICVGDRCKTEFLGGTFVCERVFESVAGFCQESGETGCCVQMCSTALGHEVGYVFWVVFCNFCSWSMGFGICWRYSPKLLYQASVLAHEVLGIASPWTGSPERTRRWDGSEMGICTQKRVALTGSRRLLALIHHYLHNRGYESDV